MDTLCDNKYITEEEDEEDDEIDFELEKKDKEFWNNRQNYEINSDKPFDLNEIINSS